MWATGLGLMYDFIIWLDFGIVTAAVIEYVGHNHQKMDGWAVSYTHNEKS